MGGRYEYAFGYPEIDGWEPGTRVDGRILRQVSKGQFMAHQPDGHNAYGEPYWNYVRYRRPLPARWEKVDDADSN